MKKKNLCLFIIILMLYPLVCLVPCLGFAEGDLLPSWNNTQTKQTILDYLVAITDPKSSDFVPAQERIAFFDWDGTCMTEYPYYFQRALAIKHIEQKLSEDASLKTIQPYKAVACKDFAFCTHFNSHETIFLEAFKGTLQADYLAFVRTFIEQHTMPYWDCPAPSLVYQPAKELLLALQKNQFTVYICSTAEQECVRELVTAIWPLSSVHIIGSQVKKEILHTHRGRELILTHEMQTPDNREKHKIDYFFSRTGKFPILGFGNSNGDRDLLDKVKESPYKSLALLLNHDDSEREHDYQDAKLLNHAEKQGWVIVSMKKDFKEVFLDKPKLKPYDR